MFSARKPAGDAAQVDGAASRAPAAGRRSKRSDGPTRSGRRRGVAARAMARRQPARRPARLYRRPGQPRPPRRVAQRPARHRAQHRIVQVSQYSYFNGIILF